MKVAARKQGLRPGFVRLRAIARSSGIYPNIGGSPTSRRYVSMDVSITSRASTATAALLAGFLEEHPTAQASADRGAQEHTRHSSRVRG
jgi:hypothetical protein